MSNKPAIRLRYRLRTINFALHFIQVEISALAARLFPDAGERASDQWLDLVAGARAALAGNREVEACGMMTHIHHFSGNRNRPKVVFALR